VRALFFASLLGLASFELLSVYFIMPMPGSQRHDTLALAYGLFSVRWVVRLGSALAVLASLRQAWARGWVATAVGLVASLVVVGVVNFGLSADAMFRPPRVVAFEPRASNRVDEAAVVMGVEHAGVFRAYPVRFLAYHHQVADTLGDLPVLVTYCSVCRTGRVFVPKVEGQLEHFRLVGMDHFNGMFEDATTHSWWRQATGEAVTGPRTGTRLEDVAFSQVTLATWFALHPEATVLQLDEAAKELVDDGSFERGQSPGSLTGTDRASWHDKSWVVGVERQGLARAFDWNRLKAERVLNATIGQTPMVLVLGRDDTSFAAFERPADQQATLASDGFELGGRRFDLSGTARGAPAGQLVRLSASQEFWHSWRTFHPQTARDE
jgi:hypothetical protein